MRPISGGCFVTPEGGQACRVDKCDQPQERVHHLVLVLVLVLILVVACWGADVLTVSSEATALRGRIRLGSGHWLRRRRRRRGGSRKKSPCMFQSPRPPLPQNCHHLHERVREATGSKLQVGGVFYMFTASAHKCAEVTYKLRSATDQLTALIS